MGNDKIIIQNLSGIEKILAKQCDDGDGILQVRKDGYDEISVFNKLKKENELILGNLDDYVTDKTVCKKDATEVRKTDAPKQLPSKQDDAVKKNNVKYNKNTEFFSENVKNIDVELFNKALNKILPLDSALKNKGSAFVDMSLKVASERNSSAIDPFLLVAISMQESGSGTSKMATDGRNNIAGMVGLTFSSVENCIESMTNLVDKRANENNLSTIEKLAKSGKYCAPSAAQEWTNNVIFYAEQLKSSYNKLIFSEKNNEYFKKHGLLE